jgi:excisionase family DNA binding protein
MPAAEAVRLYSVRSAAERLQTSVDYVYDRIKDGSLGVVELGSGRAKQRIRADVLQKFIDDRSYAGVAR